jgi:hypothetical protein
MVAIANFYLYSPMFRDFTNPSLPSEQKGRSSQVCTVDVIFLKSACNFSSIL